MPKQKTGTSPQTDKDKLDTAEQEARLRERQRALWDDIQREVEKTRGQQFSDLIQQRADPDDRAVADMLIDLNESEITRDVDELRAVQYALGRIESGSYGICQSCGRHIVPERLRAIPETPLCIECQARAEQNKIETPSL
ncbi:MAG TPA: TraR/DksA family transcriptional regulator [Gammaproteobacteria bacterium]|nr:TraR/DksA family transcriptional regulator [Gammaproteobacteria bacterium]